MKLVNQEKVKFGCSMFHKDTHYKEKTPVFYVIIVDGKANNGTYIFSTVLSFTRLLYVCQLPNDTENKS